MYVYVCIILKKKNEKSRAFSLTYIIVESRSTHRALFTFQPFNHRRRVYGNCAFSHFITRTIPSRPLATLKPYYLRVGNTCRVYVHRTRIHLHKSHLPACSCYTCMMFALAAAFVYAISL